MEKLFVRNGFLVSNNQEELENLKWKDGTEILLNSYIIDGTDEEIVFKIARNVASCLIAARDNKISADDLKLNTIDLVKKALQKI